MELCAYAQYRSWNHRHCICQNMFEKDRKMLFLNFLASVCWYSSFQRKFLVCIFHSYDTKTENYKVLENSINCKLTSMVNQLVSFLVELKSRLVHCILQHVFENVDETLFLNISAGVHRYSSHQRRFFIRTIQSYGAKMGGYLSANWWSNSQCIRFKQVWTPRLYQMYKV